jgi:hypothetical protein
MKEEVCQVRGSGPSRGMCFDFPNEPHGLLRTALRRGL